MGIEVNFQIINGILLRSDVCEADLHNEYDFRFFIYNKRCCAIEVVFSHWQFPDEENKNVIIKIEKYDEIWISDEIFCGKVSDVEEVGYIDPDIREVEYLRDERTRAEGMHLVIWFNDDYFIRVSGGVASLSGAGSS